MLLVRVIAALVLGFACCLARGQERAGSEAAQAGARRFALLVGCTEYPELRKILEEEEYRRTRLAGPANDVELMARTLHERLDFPAQGIVKLSGWPDEESERPTFRNIEGHLQRLARASRAGDQIVILLAGHGTQLPDSEKGDETDGMDEVFLPADVGHWEKGQKALPNALRDDVLGGYVKAMAGKGARVWLILDSCHSGTMVRAPGEEVQMRQIDPEDLGAPPAVSARGEGGLETATGEDGLEGAGVVAMYAAQSYQVAPEMPLPRGQSGAPRHGLFTYMLASEIQRCAGNLTFQELFAQVVNAYQRLPYSATVPFAEGDLRLQVYGTGREHRTLLSRVDGDLKLDAGTLSDLVPGTVLAVFQPGQLDQAPLGHVEVVSAELTSSRCKPAAFKDSPALAIGAITGAMPVRVVSRPRGDWTLKVAVADESERASTLEALSEDDREWLAENENRFTCVGQPARADCVVVLGKCATWVQERGGEPAYCRFRIGAEGLQDALDRIYRARNLKRIAGEAVLSPLPNGLVVEMLRGGQKGPRVEANETLRPGEKVVFRLQNKTGADWDLAILQIDPRNGIQPVFPHPGLFADHDSPRFTRDDTKEVHSEKVNVGDSTLGLHHLLILAVPAEGQAPADFSRLMQPPLDARTAGHMATRRGPIAQEGLLDLLDEFSRGAAPQARNLDIGSGSLASSSLTLFPWHTAWGELAKPTSPAAREALVLRPDNLWDLQPPRPSEAWTPESDLTKLRGDLGELYGTTAPAIVIVRTRAGHGTGFLIDRKGLVLTNSHVIRDGYAYGERGERRVWIFRGTPDTEGFLRIVEEPLPADVVHADPQRDLALLQLVEGPGPFASVRPVPLEGPGPKPGMPCVMIGHPAAGLLWSIRTGHVAGAGLSPRDLAETAIGRLSLDPLRAQAVTAQLGGDPQVRIALSSCQANPGDSGGPLLDERGNLLAVTYAIPGELQLDKFVYHVHLDEVREFLEERPPLETGPLLAIPDPWDLSPEVELRSSDASDRKDQLFAGNERAWQVLIDLDDDTRDIGDEPGALEALVASRGFDWELALHFRPERRLAFYDLDNDGRFDLLLDDYDEDWEADAVFRRDAASGEWSFEDHIDLPWLSVSLFEEEIKRTEGDKAAVDFLRKAREKLQNLAR